MNDSFDLRRFVYAQEPFYRQVVDELSRGRKRTHWMWFIFPQIKGLGSSAMAVRFAISSLAEARAYLDHAELGPRLRECCEIVVGVAGRSVDEIFGYPDDLKFHSSITLFAKAAVENRVFLDALEKYFGGELDRATVERL